MTADNRIDIPKSEIQKVEIEKSDHQGIDVALGDPVDLWDGLRPRFLSSGVPWRTPPVRPLRTECATCPDAPAQWDAPCLSLHGTVAGLLSSIFDYAVGPMIGLEGPHEISSGALMSGQSLAEIEARLKMDLTDRPAAAWLLVSITGRRATRYYTPEWHGLNRKAKIMQWLTPEGRNALARLRLSGMRHEGVEFYGDLTARQAGRYLDYISGFGTHVVRSLSFGDRLFQVFAVDRDLLPGLKQSFGREGGREVCGAAAYGLAHFTRRPWVIQASPILSASDGDAARRLAHHEIWSSDDPAASASLLAPRAVMTPSLTALLDTLPANSVMGVSFASQALYLEDHRADAWSRIMRAGLCQRFPDIRLSGWRLRGSFSVAAFLASAALSGDEALCRPVGPALPELAFALDMTASRRIMAPSTDCLALFVATDPGSGRAAEIVVDGPAFDPRVLTVPFVDGALCVSDGQDARSCLVEGVWIAASDGGRPAIASAPAEVDATLLIRHAGRLSAYLALMDRLQRASIPSGTVTAMRRCSVWLAKAMSGHPVLMDLRWQALWVARGGGQAAPGDVVVDDRLAVALTELVTFCLAWLAMKPDGPAFDAALHDIQSRLQAFYRSPSLVTDLAELDRRSLAAGEALQRRFASFREVSGLPQTAAALFTAGAGLCAAPDLRRMPHAILPGDGVDARLWNAFLGVRARYAESRSIIAAAQGRVAEAVALLDREIIDCRDVPVNPAQDLITSLETLSSTLPHLGEDDRHMLAAEMAELLSLNRSARWLSLASAAVSPAPAASGPQLHRLLLVLDVLQLCRLAPVPLASLDSLAPELLVARLHQALKALAGHRRSA